MRIALVIGAFASALAFVVFAVTRAHEVVPNPNALPPASATLHTGEPAPLDYRLALLASPSALSLAAATRDRPVVVNFFASWCTACAAELDAFATVAKQHASEVVFLGVDTNDADHHAAISLLAHAGARYPVVVDTSSLTMTTAYGIANLPVTFFLDARHRVVREVLGAQSAAQLRANVAHLLAAP